MVVAAAVAITCMLLVRRTAPEGSYFADGDRASGVFGVLATGFAVLIGFVVFLAFESFDTSRSGAEAEARTVAQQMETAQFMPAGARPALSGELICYARFVVHSEWPEMRAGTLDDSLNPWGVATFKTLRTIDPRSASEQAAYSKWLDQRSDRENARADRAHGAEGVIPLPLWIVLFLSAAIIFVFMMFFADSAERARRAGDDDRRCRGRDLIDLRAAVVPRQPLPRGGRRSQTGGHGAHASGSSRRRSSSPRCIR